MKRLLRKPRHFWGEVLFAMFSIGSGDTFLVNLVGFAADILLAAVAVALLVLLSHLMRP